MAKFCTLASGSSGNSTYISQGGEGILIDVGISCRAVSSALAEIGVVPRHIRAVFLTHEHIDHIKGLKRFIRESGASVYGSPQTLSYIVEKDMVESAAHLFPLDGTPVEVNYMKVHSFSTPHDSVGSLGYRIETSDDHRIAVVTDLGHVTPTVEENITGCDMVMIESNYDIQMLRTGNYPMYLKKRISGENGHLSNSDCADLVERLVRFGSTRFVLAHLSQENNLPMIADQTIFSRLNQYGLIRGKDYLLSVAPRVIAGGLVAF